MSSHRLLLSIANAKRCRGEPHAGTTEIETEDREKARWNEGNETHDFCVKIQNNSSSSSSTWCIENYSMNGRSVSLRLFVSTFDRFFLSSSSSLWFSVVTFYCLGILQFRVYCLSTTTATQYLCSVQLMTSADIRRSKFIEQTNEAIAAASGRMKIKMKCLHSFYELLSSQSVSGRWVGLFYFFIHQTFSLSIPLRLSLSHRNKMQKMCFELSIFSRLHRIEYDYYYDSAVPLNVLLQNSRMRNKTNSRMHCEMTNAPTIKTISWPTILVSMRREIRDASSNWLRCEWEWVMMMCPSIQPTDCCRSSFGRDKCRYRWLYNLPTGQLFYFTNSFFMQRCNAPHTVYDLLAAATLQTNMLHLAHQVHRSLYISFSSIQTTSIHSFVRLWMRRQNGFTDNRESSSTLFQNFSISMRDGAQMILTQKKKNNDFVSSVAR